MSKTNQHIIRIVRYRIFLRLVVNRSDVNKHHCQKVSTFYCLCL